MARLLIVHHTPSPSLHSMFDAVLAGATNDELAGDPNTRIEVEHRAALGTTAADVLTADGYVLGTPANLGYMSGALKHFFDTIYYPCLEETRGRPYAVYLHGNSDTDGAATAIAKITTGLDWRPVQDPVVVLGEPSQSDLDACWELGAVTAASLTL